MSVRERVLLSQTYMNVWHNIRLYTSEPDECKMIEYHVSEKNLKEIILTLFL